MIEFVLLSFNLASSVAERNNVVLYETSNFGFCTFLDASKAFDRVQYYKLFRLLIKRGLPAFVVRLVIHLYIGHAIRVSWCGLASEFFVAHNGVKQGGVAIAQCCSVFLLMTF